VAGIGRAGIVPAEISAMNAKPAPSRNGSAWTVPNRPCAVASTALPLPGARV